MDKKYFVIGFTLVELLIVIVIASFITAIMYNLLKGLLSRGAKKLTQHLYLQLEARRALTNIYNELQTGIEVLLPPPGSTLPFLIVRDNSNTIKMMYLKKISDTSNSINKDVFSLYTINYDPLSCKATIPKEILRNVVKLNFTAHGYNNIVITGIIKEDKAKFAFINQINFKNFMADDGEI